MTWQPQASIGMTAFHFVASAAGAKTRSDWSADQTTGSGRTTGSIVVRTTDDFTSSKSTLPIHPSFLGFSAWEKRVSTTTIRLIIHCGPSMGGD